MLSVRVEDCIFSYEKYGVITVIADGKVVGFNIEKEDTKEREEK